MLGKKFDKWLPNKSFLKDIGKEVTLVKAIQRLFIKVLKKKNAPFCILYLYFEIQWSKYSSLIDQKKRLASPVICNQANKALARGEKCKYKMNFGKYKSSVNIIMR